MADATTTVREWLASLIDQSLEKLTSQQAAQRIDTETKRFPTGEEEAEAIKSVVELFFEYSQQDKLGLQSEDMVDFLLTFVLAAQDTSALTLMRFFMMVMKHRHVAQRIRDEMATVLPQLGATLDTYLTTDYVHQLVYLEATLREVLRLYPTGPLTQKEVVRDTVICGDVFLKKGDLVCLSMYAIARNPDVWGPDAADFKPERWIGTNGQLITVPATTFPAFGAGPRICVGMKLGMLELRVVAANLVHRYDFSLAVPNDGDYLVGITLAMKKQIFVNAKRACAAS